MLRAVYGGQFMEGSLWRAVLGVEGSLLRAVLGVEGNF